MKKCMMYFCFLLLANHLNADWNSFYIGGWTVMTREWSEDNGYIIKNAECSLYSIMGGDTIVFPEIRLDRHKNLISCTEAVVEVDFIATNGYRVKASGFCFKKEGMEGPGLYVRGKIYLLPEKSHSIEVFVKSEGYDFYLNASGAIHYPEQTHPIQVPYHDYILHAAKYHYGKLREEWGSGTGLVLEDITIELPETNGIITLDRMTFYPDGSEGMPGEVNSCTIGRTGYELGITGGVLEDGILRASGFLNIPHPFDDAALYCDAIHINPRGYWEIKKISRLDSLLLERIKVNIKNPTWTGEAIKFGAFVFQFPHGFPVPSIYVENMILAGEGRFDGFTVYPFEFQEYEFSIDHISCDGDSFLFHGTARDEDYNRWDIMAMKIHFQGFFERLILGKDGETRVFFEVKPEDPQHLYMSLTRKDEKGLRDYIDAGGKITIDWYDTPLLINRITNKDPWSVTWLLEHGADPNYEYDNETALYYAVNNNEITIVKSLLDFGAEPSRFSKHNPLAICIGTNKEITKLLLTKKVNFTDTGSDNHSMFDIAMNTGDIEYLKALIAAGLPYDITFRGSATPVQKAIWSGNEDLVRFVCELGFSPLLENTNGESGLWMMIQYEKEEETLELCEYIQRNQFITPAGKSYLLHAIDHRQYRVAAELVKKGADVNYQDEKGNMVYDYCIKSDNQALFELCREYGMIIPEETSFHTTIDLPIDEHASRKKGDIIAWAYDPSDHSFWAIGHLQNEKFLSTAHSWLIHIDAEGNPVSMKMLARYTLKDSPSRVYLLSDNTILLIRTAFNYRYPYGYDMYISKYTKEGELIWSKVLKTDQNDIFLDSFLTENDLLYIVLSSQEKSKTNMQEALWLVRCNRDGEFHFSRKIGMYTHIIEAHIVERNHMCVIASLVEDEKACYAFIEGRGERGALLWKRGITAGHTDYIIDLCQGLNDNCLFAITERKKKESTLILASWSCHGDLLFSKEIIHDGHVHTHLIKRSGDYILFSYVKASKKNELQVTRLHADGRVMFSRSVSCNFDDGQICSGMTDRGGLIISGPDSRSRGFSTISCAEMIKFNELLGGVIGNIIKVEATEKELDYQPIE